MEFNDQIIQTIEIFFVAMGTRSYTKNVWNYSQFNDTDIVKNI